MRLWWRRTRPQRAWSRATLVNAVRMIDLVMEVEPSRQEVERAVDEVWPDYDPAVLPPRDHSVAKIREICLRVREICGNLPMTERAQAILGCPNNL